MSANFQIEIISPDNSLIKTDAEEVVIPSFEGEMGILKGHVPLITFLRPGLIKIKTKTVKEYFVEEGTVEFSKDKLLILSSTIKELKDLDKKSLENLIDESNKKFSNSDITDKEKYLLFYKIETLKNISL